MACEGSTGLIEATILDFGGTGGGTRAPTELFLMVDVVLIVLGAAEELTLTLTLP